jgi:acyl-coenzyme A synthetase/AMP-(fatty) acid ligase
VTLAKPVPAHHKREIVVVRGTETAEQKRRTYKELLEQVNRAGVAGKAVAIRKLTSGDMVLTMDNEQACTS